jgi:ribose transport system substrate-binding protein
MTIRKVLFLALALTAGAILAFGQVKDPYKAFNDYRAAAKSGKAYPGAPLKGKVVGFANINGTLAFCIDVENNIKEHLKRAGLDLGKGWINMDNMGDAGIGRKNVDIMLSRKPSFFIEFQLDPVVNSIAAAKFGAAKIPILAVDVPVPGSPYMGVNNYAVSLMAGHTIARLIREKWGGWDGVDAVFIGRLTLAGDAVLLRTEGVAAALAEEFGIAEDDPRIVRFDFDFNGTEEDGYGFAPVLAAHPGAVKVAMTAVNEPFMMGIISVMQGAGRWDPANNIVVTLGADEIGREWIRDGTIDAAIAFFPERYGEYVVPAVCAMLAGNPVPPYLFVENEAITRASIDTWYPKRK